MFEWKTGRRERSAPHAPLVISCSNQGQFEKMLAYYFEEAKKSYVKRPEVHFSTAITKGPNGITHHYSALLIP